ncbi:DUF4338 domain-containing protein [Salinibacter ruber]|uniref:DUF4338 domain-containing protein n=1 Tax=Salinibacter ruber TaxID=146919 RepID=UPI002168E4FC|nr:DUF4338 domain-containing protein [Salinibacter ruber]MCS3757485.1 hypothetical protein [Salinibacter ruber]
MPETHYLDPDVPDATQDLLERFYSFLGKDPKGEDKLSGVVQSLREEVEARKTTLTRLGYLKAKAVFETIEDVLGLYWQFSIQQPESSGGAAALVAHSPDLTTTDERSAKEMKSRIRDTLVAARDDQLRDESTRSFVQEMESPSSHAGNGRPRETSIQDLFLAPEALADDLRSFADAPVHRKLGQLTDIIQPYLQFVDSDERDRFTGLRLLDIWRYARCTWSIPHKQTPGRRMRYLVRDAARDSHPIIGIGAISSAVMQLTPRDREIGWSPIALAQPSRLKEYVRSELDEEPTEQLLQETRKREFESVFGPDTWEVVQAFLDQLDQAINYLYIDDFLSEGILNASDLSEPSTDCLESIEKRRQEVKNASSNQSFTATDDYEKDAKSSLYTRKRATVLKRVLDAKCTLQNFIRENSGAPDQELRNLIVSKGSVRRALKMALRSVKKRRMAGLMDITTCGAVSPYNEVLGGKLVSFLMASPQVIAEYRQRYADQESVIASRMRGEPVVRRPELALLSTTSLYAVGSSQYNRLKAPTAKGKLHYNEVGKSSGHGHIHISERTFQTLKDLLDEIHTSDESEGRPNNRFGNGVNYKMRTIRAALSEVGLKPLHQHEHPRLIYLVPLANNWRDYLTGKDDTPTYLYDDTEDSPEEETEALIDFWKLRWFYKRAQKDFIIERIEEIDGKVKVSSLIPEFDEEPKPDPAPLFEKEAD